MLELNYHLNKAKQRAEKIGKNMSRLIYQLINYPRYPLKNLRKIEGILNLQDLFSDEALEHAAQQALEFDKLNFNSIKNFARHYRQAPPIQSAPLRDVQLICLQGGKHE
jgi:hypothetical protein